MSGYKKAQAFSVSDSFFFLLGLTGSGLGLIIFHSMSPRTHQNNLLKKHNFTRVYKVEAMYKWPRVSKG